MREKAITPYERACFMIRDFGNKSLEPHFNTIRNHVDKLTQEKAEMERALELACEWVDDCPRFYNIERLPYCSLESVNIIKTCPKWDGLNESSADCWKQHFITKGREE